MKLQLSSDWTEFLRVLISHRVRFLLIGGHAVAAWAEPRLTEDLDVLVEPTAPNARRLHAALAEFGFGALLPKPVAFEEANRVWMLGRKPQRIDILTGIDGVSFSEAWKSKVEIEFAAKPLFVIGRAALLANKQAAGRAKDLADVEAIERFAGRPKKKRSPPRKPPKRPV